jgi:hypothetical protein
VTWRQEPRNHDATTTALISSSTHTFPHHCITADTHLRAAIGLSWVSHLSPATHTPFSLRRCCPRHRQLHNNDDSDTITMTTTTRLRHDHNEQTMTTPHDAAMATASTRFSVAWPPSPRFPVGEHPAHSFASLPALEFPLSCVSQSVKLGAPRLLAHSFARTPAR